MNKDASQLEFVPVMLWHIHAPASGALFGVAWPTWMTLKISGVINGLIHKNIPSRCLFFSVELEKIMELYCTKCFKCIFFKSDFFSQVEGVWRCLELETFTHGRSHSMNSSTDSQIPGRLTALNSWMTAHTGNHIMIPLLHMPLCTEKYTIHIS